MTTPPQHVPTPEENAAAGIPCPSCGAPAGYPCDSWGGLCFARVLKGGRPADEERDDRG